MNKIKKPEVSIITCFLNTDQYLEEAITSVLKQEYENWELLLIDDGSSDNSSQIAKYYASRYSNKIYYYEHEKHANKGLSASRNLGIKVSSGEFLTFLDADDVWRPQLLSGLLNLIEQHDVSLVCEATEYWYDWKDKGKENCVIQIGSRHNHVFTPPQLMLDLYPLGKSPAPCVCGLIVKKVILVKHGGFDETFTGMYEDQVFLSKFYLNEPVYISSTCNNLYRQRPDSLVGASHSKGNYHSARKKFLDWLQNYLKEKNIHHPEVLASFKNAKSHYKIPVWSTLRSIFLLKKLKRLFRR